MIDLSQFSPSEKRVLWLTCPTHFCCHFFILTFPAVTLPMSRTLGLSLEDIVRLSFWMYVTYGLFALPVGLAVDRWRAKWMLVIGQFLMGIGLVFAGLYPNPDALLISLGIVGTGASVYHPAGLSLISRTVRKRGMAMGVNGVFGNLGIASAPLVTGILTWSFGWQNAFIIMGGLAIAIGVGLSALKVDETPVEVAPKTSAGGAELAKYFLIMCVALVCGGIAYRGNMLLLPAYFELKTTFFVDLLARLEFMRTQGTATLAATVLTSAVLVAGIFGQLVGGRMADRMDLRRAYLTIHSLSLPFILAMAFVSDYLLAICAAGYAFFSLGMQPVENSLIAALTPRKWRSTSYAVKFILNFGVGATVVYLIAPIKQAFSLETVYVFLAGATTLLVMSIVWLTVASRPLGEVRN